MSSRDADAVIGRVGCLIVATRGAAGAGEVLLNLRGGREAYLAWSAEALPRGASVLVVDLIRPRTVDVVAWESAVAVPEQGR